MRTNRFLLWMLISAVGLRIVHPERAMAQSTRASRPVIQDSVYLQEIGTKIPSDEPLTGVAMLNGKTWVGTDKGLLLLKGRSWVPETNLNQPIQRLVTVSGRVWAMAPDGLYRYQDAAWRRISKEPVTDVCLFRGDILASTRQQIWRVQGDHLEPVSTNSPRFAITRLVSHAETLFVHGTGRLAPWVSGSFGGMDAYSSVTDQAWDWGTLPSTVTRDVLSQGSSLYLATDRGLGVVRGMSLTAVGGMQGLPFEDTTCLASGFQNDLWIGTSRGAIRWVDGHFDYFSGQRWIPGERVQAIAVEGHRVSIATDRGLGVIDYEPYTLAKKAAYYERHLEEWGQKRLGFNHKLEWDAGSKQFVREVSDNDGGYSGNYLTAQSYRYAVTHDPQARREATNTFHALRWLESMTGIRGFPARAVWVKGDRGHQSDHGPGTTGEWHDTADGLFEWKGDTSSDELCSHFHCFSVFLELAAQGVEVDQAKEHLRRIANHLIDHRWQLVDLDGKPTRWGRWDPEYFTTDEGRYDRGLQSVELLSFIKTAEHWTGEKRFTQAYEELIGLGYPGYTLRTRSTFPQESVLHFLDELAFWSFGTLLRYETNPELHAIYRRAYERSYEVVRVEQNPWFNFLYGSLTGNVLELIPSVEHLRGWPLDLRIWSYQNSHRADLKTPPGYVAPKGGTRTFPPRETEPLRWDHWLMQMDGGNHGNDVAEPSAWLLAYWMGRYYGWIGEAETKDPELIRVEHTFHRELGAKPYIGPSRPQGF